MSPTWTFAMYDTSLSGKYKWFLSFPTSVATVSISHSFKSVKVIPIPVARSLTVAAAATTAPVLLRTSTLLFVLIFVLTSKSIP